MDKNYKQYLPKINFTLEVLLEGLRSTNLRIDNISGGGGGSSPTLQGVLDAGNIATTPIVIKADTEEGTTIKSTIGTQNISMEVKVGNEGNQLSFGASAIDLLSWYPLYESWIGSASLGSTRNPETGNSYGTLSLNDELNYTGYLRAYPPVERVSVGGGQFYFLERKKK